jgi:ABC-type lipoprotein export system ATPase subunit
MTTTAWEDHVGQEPDGVAEPDILCRDLVRIFVTEGIEVQALQGLNLRLERGELVALVGASGSGKSTLLSILSGLDRPTGGTARVAGQDLATMTRRERVEFQRSRVGFVWQQTSRNLLPYLTAAQNVAVPLTISGQLRGAARAARVDELLELLGATHCRDRLPALLTGGEQQRVAIAVALAGSPKVLLADEPTGELDDATSADVLEAFRRVNHELGTTVLIVTHDPAIADYVSRTVRIRDGRTSLEVLRRRQVGEDGVEHEVVEEFAVLDQVGRLQLPPDYVSQLEMRDRVRLHLDDDHVQVWPGAAGPATTSGEPR